jgi:hypothetical protein
MVLWLFGAPQTDPDKDSHTQTDAINQWVEVCEDDIE